MTEKNTQALECGEEIYVINKSEISEYTVRKSKEYFYVKIYLKNGNSIYGSVENQSTFSMSLTQKGLMMLMTGDKSYLTQT